MLIDVRALEDTKAKLELERRKLQERQDHIVQRRRKTQLISH